MWSLASAERGETFEDRQGHPVDMPTEKSSDFWKAVGLRLHAARMALDATQGRAGGMVGSGMTTISNYERGIRLLPPLTAAALADRWGVTTDWFYRERLDGVRADLQDRIKLNYDALRKGTALPAPPFPARTSSPSPSPAVPKKRKRSAPGKKPRGPYRRTELNS